MRGLSLVGKFILTLFIAHYMQLEVLGVYGLIVGICTVLPVVVGFGIINNFARTAVTQELHQVTNSLASYSLGFLFVYALGAVIAGTVGLYFGSLDMILLVLLIAALEHANNDIFVLLNNLKKPFLANISFFIRSGLWIYLYILAAFVFPQLRAIDVLLYAWATGGIAAVAYFFFVSRSWPWNLRISILQSLKWLKSEIGKSRILYLNDISNTLSQYIDRYMITLFLGLELTGLYVLFWSISNALANLVRTGTISIYRPRLISSFVENGRLYRQIYSSCMKQALGISVILAMAAYGGLYMILPYLKEPLAEFYFGVYFLVLASFVVRMLYEVLGIVFYSQHQDIKTFVTGLFLLGASIIFPAILIPVWGLTGAAWAALLTVIVGSISRYRVLAKGIFHA